MRSSSKLTFPYQVEPPQKPLRGTNLRALAAALVALVAVAALPSTAYADICSSLRAQVGGGQSSSNPEVVQLNRQLSAIRAMQRQRGCKGGESGFFSSCGGLATQAAQVQRKIASASTPGFFGGSGRTSAIRARMDALGCGTGEARRKQQVVRWDGSARLPGGNAMLFCVRQSDGYYFPTPNSQFIGKGDDYKTTLDRCQYICDDKGMDIYTLYDLGQETEEMRSVSNGKAYKDLPAAFAYREDTDFKSCDLQRYYRRVDEARARTVTPTDLSNAIIPLPSSRPEMPATAQADGLPAEATAFVTPKAVPMDPARKVRVVGDPFLPLEMQ